MKFFLGWAAVLVLFFCCAPKHEESLRLSVLAGPNITIPSSVPDLAIVEPHLSVHPQNGNHLLVAAMVITDRDNPYESARLVSFISTDGGTSWQQTDHDYWGYDPWTAILPTGRTLMTWLGQPGRFTGEMAVQVFQSPDGGLTWEPEVQTIPGEYDGTKMAFRETDQLIGFAALKFGGNMDVDIYFDQSIGGARFQQPALIRIESDHVGFSQPALLSTGEILVPAVENGEEAVVYISTDNGKTFDQKFQISTLLGQAKGYFHFGTDNSPTATKDRVYFVRATGKAGEYGGIWVNYSPDKGRTWSENIRVDSFGLDSKSRAIVPNLAVNHQGVLGISWIDQQHEKGKNDLYFALSADGGSTFLPPSRISSISTDPATPKNADVANKFPGGGHYNAIAAKPDGSFQLVWGDSRNGVFHLQTCNVRIQITPDK